LITFRYKIEYEEPKLVFYTWFTHIIDYNEE